LIFDKLAKLGPREKAGAAIALFCILAVLMDRLVVQAILRSYRRLDAAIVQEQKDLDYVNRVLQYEGRIMAEYEKAGSMVGEGGPAADVMDAMREAVDEVARKTGVQLLSTEQREPRSTPFFEEHVVESRFEAGMNDLLSFLHALRGSSAMLRVRQLILTPDKTGGLVKGSIVISKVVVPKIAVDG